MLLTFSLLTAGLGQTVNLRPAPPMNYDPSIPVVDFDFERVGSSVPRWTIELYEDGRGSYDEGVVDPAAKGAMILPVEVDEATHKLLLSGVDAVRSKHCETQAKNIANTGRKKLAYGFRLGDFHSDCTYNYSDNEQLNKIANAFQAIAETVQEGEKLQHDLRFDRLGLDAEMDFLMEEVKGGRAIEVQNISGVLNAIAGDERVMERVRRKAARLLEGVVGL